MKSESMFMGLGGLVLGVFVGMNVGNSGADKSERRIMSDVDSTVAAMQEQVLALDGRLAGLEDSIAAGEASRASLSEQIDGAVSALSDNLGNMSASMAASIAEADAAQAAAMEERFAALSGSIGKMASTAAAPAPVETAIAAAPATAEETPASTAQGTKVGQTASLLDGKARVFVSGMDADAGTVRVAVNGQGLAMLGGALPVTFDTDGETCTLNLDALDAGGAHMSAACIAAVETVVTPTPGPTASQEAVASGGEPKGPGQTAWLLDGKARIFVSGVDADAGTARVAINGLSTAVLGGTRPVTFDAEGATCTLQLDDLVEGRVKMSASCN
ncbi:MAG: hypothetical protein AB8B85_02600 [Paracoccaceae bacterium]